MGIVRELLQSFHIGQLFAIEFQTIHILIIRLGEFACEFLE